MKLSTLRAIFLAVIVQAVLCGERVVVQITVLSRSGARTNFRKIPNMDIISRHGSGMITPTGMRQHFLLGSELRRRYPEILQAENIKSSEIQVFSSPSSSCQMSAISQLQGLFPPSSGVEVSTKDKEFWSPPFEGFDVKIPANKSALPEQMKLVPFNTYSSDMDFMFYSDFASTCSGGGYKENELRSKKYASARGSIEGLIKELESANFSSKHFSSQDSWTMGNLDSFSDDMVCYRNYFGTFYSGMTSRLMTKLHDFMGFKMALDLSEKNFAQLRTSVIAKTISSGLQVAAKDTAKAKKIRLFVGHDFNIMTHLLLLNLTNVDCLNKTLNEIKTERCPGYPAFASQLIYELSQLDEKYYVRTLYNGVPYKVCANSEAPSFFCLIDDFIPLFEKALIIDDTEQQSLCRNKYLENEKTWIELQKYQDQEIQGYSSIVSWSIATGASVNLILIILIIWKTRSLRKSFKRLKAHTTDL